MTSTPLFPVSPLEGVREGMTVVDQQGHSLGRVKRIHLGYPDAIEPGPADLNAGLPSAVGVVVAPLENTGGTTSIGAGWPYVVRELYSDPDVPDELRLELLRAGFIELDAPGVRGPARFIHGDQIVEVGEDVVRVRLNR